MCSLYCVFCVRSLFCMSSPMTRMLLSKNFCTVDCPIPPAAPVISAVFIVGLSLWLGGYLLR